MRLQPLYTNIFSKLLFFSVLFVNFYAITFTEDINFENYRLSHVEDKNREHFHGLMQFFKRHFS